MSLVFDSLDVSAGPTLGIELSSPSPAHDQQPRDLLPVDTYFSGRNLAGRGACAKEETHSPGNFAGDLDPEGASSDSSSSIGVPSDNDDDDSEDDTREGHCKSSGCLSSLASLDDSLPIKRGLSSHFIGKSKSFASLSDVRSVKEMEKPENPLNKKRRLMIISSWSKKKSSFYSWQNPKSMPLLALKEDESYQEDGREEEDEDDDSSNENDLRCRYKYRRHTPPKGFKSCFSLADL